jgi:hypothetical protein
MRMNIPAKEFIVNILILYVLTEINYESLVLKSWEEEEEIEMAPQKKRNKKENEIAPPEESLSIINLNDFSAWANKSVNRYD